MYSLVAQVLGQGIGEGLQAGAKAGSAYSAASSLEGQALWKDYEADLAGEDAEFAALLHARESKKVIGNQKAAYAASGVRVDMGSPLDVMAETARMAEVDRITMEMDSKRSQTASRAESSMLRSGAKNLKRGARTSLYTSALRGSLNVLGAVSKDQGW